MAESGRTVQGHMGKRRSGPGAPFSRPQRGGRQRRVLPLQRIGAPREGNSGGTADDDRFALSHDRLRAFFMEGAQWNL